MSRPAYLVCNTTNLGDDIQSLAAKQFLPPNSIEIDRDRMSTVQEDVFVIANGWFMHNSAVTPSEKERRTDMPFDWPPPPSVNPLLISMHLAKPARQAFLAEKSLSYLRAHGPVGCRDLATKEVFDSAGVDTYFSGCLTLTLKKRTATRTQNVYFVDVGGASWKDLYLRGGATIRRILRRSLGRPPIVLTHQTDERDHEVRAQRANELLDLYAGAKLVVTSRLHCALPCLALGTPVVFVVPDSSDPRFTGLSDLLTMYTHKDIRRGNFAIDWDTPRANPDDYLALAKNAEARVTAFVRSNNNHDD